jgi:hypothetical protein
MLVRDTGIEPAIALFVAAARLTTTRRTTPQPFAAELARGCPSPLMSDLVRVVQVSGWWKDRRSASSGFRRCGHSGLSLGVTAVSQLMCYTREHPRTQRTNCVAGHRNLFFVTHRCC